MVSLPCCPFQPPPAVCPTRAAGGSAAYLPNSLGALVQIMFILVAMSVILCGAALAYLLARGESVRHALGFTIVLLVGPEDSKAWRGHLGCMQ